MTDYPLDRLNVNDESHQILAWLVTDGAVVAAGQPIAEIETSKATVELEAKGTGVLRIACVAGREAKVGETLYSIEDGEAPRIARNGAAAIGEAKPMTSSAPIVMPSPPSRSEGERGFVTTRSIRGRRVPGEPTQSPAPKPPDRLAGVDARKMAEIQSLSVVNPSGLVSYLYVDVDMGARTAPQAGLFARNISDLIAYEGARVIAMFPLFSAYFDQERGIQAYEQAKIGYSIDSDNDLTVYNLGACGEATLPEVRSRILSCIEAHVTRKRSASMLEATTFTITDLSAAGVSGFVPLINGRQSAILGYSHASEHVARFNLAFDHRVMSGRYAANFLTELRSRIQSHIGGGADIACYFCGRQGSEMERFQDRGFLKLVDRRGVERLSCSACFGGH